VKITLSVLFLHPSGKRRERKRKSKSKRKKIPVI